MQASGDEFGDELDRRLEAALRGYADPGEEPNPAALAARVMARAGEQKRWSDWSWIRWGLGAGVACVLALVVAAVLSDRAHQADYANQAHQANHPVRGKTAKLATQEAGVSITRAGQSSREVPRLAKALAAARPRGARTQVPKPPKLEQFPQPQPLSEQERWMLAFVSAASPEDQRVVAEAAEPPEFVRAAGVPLITTQPYKLETETAFDTLGARHGKDGKAGKDGEDR